MRASKLTSFYPLILFDPHIILVSTSEGYWESYDYRNSPVRSRRHSIQPHPVRYWKVNYIKYYVSEIESDKVFILIRIQSGKSWYWGVSRFQIAFLDKLLKTTAGENGIEWDFVRDENEIFEWMTSIDFYVR